MKTVNPRKEHADIVVVGKTSTWETVQETYRSLKETVKV